MRILTLSGQNYFGLENLTIKAKNIYLEENKLSHVKLETFRAYEEIPMMRILNIPTKVIRVLGKTYCFS